MTKFHGYGYVFKNKDLQYFGLFENGKFSKAEVIPSEISNKIFDPSNG